MRRFLLPGALLVLLAADAPAQPPSPEPGYGYADNTAVVDGWYRRFLNRRLDPAGGGWVGLLDDGAAPETVLAQILASEEYYRKAGATPRGYVVKLLTDLTGRAPPVRERDYWVNRLTRGDLEDVAYGVLRRYPSSIGAVDYRETYDYRRPVERYRPTYRP